MEKPLATPLYIIGNATINEVNTATFPEPNHIISNMINDAIGRDFISATGGSRKIFAIWYLSARYPEIHPITNAARYPEIILNIETAIIL